MLAFFRRSCVNFRGFVVASSRQQLPADVVHAVSRNSLFFATRASDRPNLEYASIPGESVLLDRTFGAYLEFFFYKQLRSLVHDFSPVFIASNHHPAQTRAILFVASR